MVYNNYIRARGYFFEEANRRKAKGFALFLEINDWHV